MSTNIGLRQPFLGDDDKKQSWKDEKSKWQKVYKRPRSKEEKSKRKSQKVEKTKRQKDRKTKIKLWCQGSFAILQCF